MRFRPIIVAAAVAAAAVGLPAHAGRPVLDGKAHKVLTFKDTTKAPQDNDSDLVTSQVSSASKATCTPPRCAQFSFLYRPAKGVKKAPLSVRIAWTVPGQDYDLYIAEDGGVVGECGAPAGTSEVVVIPKPDAGHRYTIIIDHYRSMPDTITATATFPAKDKAASTVPAAANALVFDFDCGLS